MKRNKKSIYEEGTFHSNEVAGCPAHWETLGPGTPAPAAIPLWNSDFLAQDVWKAWFGQHEL